MSRLTDRFARWTARPEVRIAVVFTAALMLYDLVCLQLPFAHYFLQAATRRSVAGVPLRIVGVLAIAAAQAAFVWAALLATRAWRVVYFVLFAAATFLEYGYVKATGSVTTALDLYVAIHNTRLWLAVAPHSVNWLAFGPVLAFGALLMATRPGSGPSLRRFIGVIVATWLIHSAYAATGYLRRDAEVGIARFAPPSVAAQAFARSATLLGWARLEEALRYQTREPVTYRAAAPANRHVILVVDESIRGDRLSVNGYARPTTPWLEELKRAGRLDTWGVAAASTLNSITSVACLLTGVSELPDRQHRVDKWPTLLQYAKAAHFRTHVLDGEEESARTVLSPRDFWYIDDWKRVTDFGDDPDTDFRIGRFVAALLQAPEPQFVIVFKRGDHFPYTINYPEGQATWNPAAASSSGQAVDDAYDSGLRYNIDGFFRAVLHPDGSLPGAVLIYTSDHAEAFTFKGKGWRPFAWETFAVPLMMFGDDRPRVDDRYLAGHHNIFATLLDLMGIPRQYWVEPYRRSLIDAKASDRDQRLVFGGDLFGADQFRVEDFDRIKNGLPAR